MTSRIPLRAALSARGVAVAAVVWAPAIQLMNIGWLVASHRETWIATLSCAFVLAVRAQTARRAFASPSLLACSGWLTAGILAAGAVDLWFWARHLASGIPSTTLTHTLLVYAMAGPLFQATYCVALATMVRSYVRAPSDESSDQAVVVASVWLAFPWVESLAAALLESSRTSDVLLNRASVYLFVAVPLVLGLASAVRAVLRRRGLIAAGARD